jgi:hypothetical protein
LRFAAAGLLCSQVSSTGVFCLGDLPAAPFDALDLFT